MSITDNKPKKLFRLRSFVYELYGEESGYETLAIVIAEDEYEAKSKFKILLKKFGNFHDFEIENGFSLNFHIDEFESWDIGKSMFWIGENY